MIMVKVHSKGTRPWMFSGVYASTDSNEMKVLWDFLMSIDIANQPWLIAEDFNCIDNVEDKMGGRPFRYGKSIKAFKELCQEADLMDLKYKGVRFTLINNRI
ncbi:hypothetical protein Cni_G23015 [Canna indica]|uniref:Uncharacterized protein n=1 Tax=Canna indica TaxID=4628 RepID=A0AAQ3QN71_9LILI|nr:hypothetical protein Cni_G23015 [Canna indica]